MNACGKPEQQPQFHHVDACSKAAYRNLHLAQWVMQLYHTKPLLQARLHFVFNAAVILLLQRIMHNDLTSSKEIDFAIDVFVRQSHAGSNYERDCLQVLKDLKVLVERYVAASSSAQQSFIADHTSSLSGLLQDDHAGVSQNRQPLSDEGGHVYHELMTWIQDDRSQLHGSFQI